MNHTVYLPDDLSKAVKAAKPDLNLSRLLRDAVTDELERRATVANTLNEIKVHEVYIEDEDGRGYTGRITGTEIACDDHEEIQVFLTDDQRVLVYDGQRSEYHHVTDNLDQELRGWLINDGVYSDAMLALGIKPTIDL